MRNSLLFIGKLFFCNTNSYINTSGRLLQEKSTLPSLKVLWRAKKSCLEKSLQPKSTLYGINIQKSQYSKFFSCKNLQSADI